MSQVQVSENLANLPSNELSKTGTGSISRNTSMIQISTNESFIFLLNDEKNLKEPQTISLIEDYESILNQLVLKNLKKSSTIEYYEVRIQWHNTFKSYIQKRTKIREHHTVENNKNNEKSSDLEIDSSELKTDYFPVLKSQDFDYLLSRLNKMKKTADKFGGFIQKEDKVAKQLQMLEIRTKQSIVFLKEAFCFQKSKP